MPLNSALFAATYATAYNFGQRNTHCGHSSSYAQAPQPHVIYRSRVFTKDELKAKLA